MKKKKPPFLFDLLISLAIGVFFAIPTTDPLPCKMRMYLFFNIMYIWIDLENIWQIIWVIVDLLTLKLLTIRLMKTLL